MSKIKCYLTDEELINKVKDWVSKLCKSGGDAWTLRVPADPDYDPDILITELCERFKNDARILDESPLPGQDELWEEVGEQLNVFWDDRRGLADLLSDLKQSFTINRK